MKNWEMMLQAVEERFGAVCHIEHGGSGIMCPGCHESERWNLEWDDGRIAFAVTWADHIMVVFSPDGFTVHLK